MISDITKPMALDETLQATNTELGNIESDIETIGTNLSTLDSTADEIAKDTTLQATNTAIGNTNTAVGNVNTTLGTQNGKLDTMNTKLQAIVDALGSQSLIGDTDISEIADGTLTGAVAQFDGDISDLDTDKADKVDSATNGNLAGLDSSGNLTDSGISGDMTTTSASGNPLSISNLKSDQLAVDPIITFEPIQAGSGTPSPSNVRPISGYDKVEVLSCGKNLFEKANIAQGSINSSGAWYLENIAQNGTAYEWDFKPNTRYTFSGYEKQGVANSNTRLRIYYTDGTVQNIFADNGTTGITFSTTSEEGKSIEKLITYWTSSGNVTISNFQIELGTSATTYEEPHKTTDISESLGQTVYGGSLDVRTGVFTVDRAIVDLGDLTWTVTTASQIARASVTLKKEGASTIISDYYEYEANQGFSTATGKISDSSSSSYSIVIFVGDSRITSSTTASDFKTLVTGQKIVYELATPITIQLTPHEISLLKDYAYVSTNGTSIALDYHNGEMASLGDVAQLSETVERSRFHHYSTDEQIIGTWIDGKPIYEKTVDCGYLSNNMSVTSPHGISNLKRVISHEGSAINLSSTYLPLPKVSPVDLQYAVDITVTTTDIIISTGVDRTDYYAYVTLRYTKTTD